ncbi:hypothetical protein C5167_012901 [Papaver somniferum]|uniref:Uncharacterized protein n=1 Tax=Papaver somniferum TaxID=3469 RepID=A0A4Y7IYU0_PAPSO|nr:hypothetical protein C5167_012901 [Papaver somniferum]
MNRVLRLKGALSQQVYDVRTRLFSRLTLMNYRQIASFHFLRYRVSAVVASARDVIVRLPYCISFKEQALLESRNMLYSLLC